MLFNYLFFDPVKIKRPIFINKELSTTENVSKLFGDDTFSRIHGHVLNGGYTKNPYFYYSGTHLS